MNYYFILTRIRSGEVEYSDKWCVSSESPLDRDDGRKSHHISDDIKHLKAFECDFIDFNDISPAYWQCDGDRMVAVSIEKEIPEAEAKVLKKYLSFFAYDHGANPIKSEVEK